MALLNGSRITIDVSRGRPRNHRSPLGLTSTLPVARQHPLPASTTNAHCAIAPPALTLVVCVVSAKPFRRSREGGNLASRPRVDDRQWVEMEGNGSELKVCRSLATRNEATTIETGPRWSARTSELRAKRGHGGPISSLHRRSKRGQTGPNGSRNQPPPIAPLSRGSVVPCEGGEPRIPVPYPSFQRRLESRADEGGAPAHLREE